MKETNKEKRGKTNKGITLIALVITIIVLLILAAVSIAMLTGENGILTQAKNAKQNTSVAAEKEQLQLAYMEAKSNKLEQGDKTGVTAKELEDQLKNDKVNVTVTENSSPIEVEFNDTKNKYMINETTGEITGPTNAPGGNPPSGDGGQFTNVDTAKTNPAGAMPEGATVTEKDATKGITIKDSNENEWIWIEVPKDIYETAENNEDYANIEADMQKYAKDYRESGYTDTFYSTYQHGFQDATEYDNWKNSMLKSIYDNGGFFIGKYEVGTKTARYTENDELTDPIIQQDVYPYTFVTCSQAQSEAKKLATGDKTSSLMFGIQWDLVCKFIEVKKGKLQDGTEVTKDMIDKSEKWGNFKDVTFPVTRGKYTTTPTSSNSWKDASSYTKPASPVLLTAGATDRNSVLNIYDLAGNVWEWTLEKSTSTSTPCSNRGSNYGSYGSTRRSFYP